jgi:hypothetical protein
MFGFMWTATAFAILAWLINFGMCCCCASRRDVKTGRRHGSSKAYGDAMAPGSVPYHDGVVNTEANPNAEMSAEKSAGGKRGRFAWGGRRRNIGEEV